MPEARALLRRVAFAAAVVLQLVALYWPREVSTGGVAGIDKVVHATIFGLVLATGVRAGVPFRPLAALLCAHAVISELIQHYLLPHRDGDVFDALADIAGVAIVTVLLRGRDLSGADPG